jgi:hypothetical protein
VLETSLEIVDAFGTSWPLSVSTAWELLPPPVPTFPVRTIIRQNDPASGCPFDPIHGYGLVINLAWDPPPGNVPVTNYAAVVIDGSGRNLMLPNSFLFTSDTAARIVRCGTHVERGAEHARFAVDASVSSSLAASAFAVATFDFQSCRDAGTPACQPDP